MLAERIPEGHTIINECLMIVGQILLVLGY